VPGTYTGSVDKALSQLSKKLLREYLRRLAKRGGQARAKALTAGQRQASARKAARARWAKRGTGGTA